jgi:hypothetical protein
LETTSSTLCAHLAQNGNGIPKIGPNWPALASLGQNRPGLEMLGQVFQTWFSLGPELWKFAQKSFDWEEVGLFCAQFAKLSKLVARMRKLAQKMLGLPNIAKAWFKMAVFGSRGPF